jgi:hypothetical protein
MTSPFAISIFAIVGVEVRRRVVAEVHLDHDPVEGADPGHGGDDVAVDGWTRAASAFAVGVARTPEGHVVRFAPGTQRVVGLTAINARSALDRDGRLIVIVPETVEASAPRQARHVFVVEAEYLG